MRTALGIITGIIAAFVCIFPAEMIGYFFYPPLARLAGAMPTVAKVLMLAAWFVGALAGFWVANRVARKGIAGWIVALLVITLGIATMAMSPTPTRTWAGGVFLPLLAGGERQGRHSKAHRRGPTLRAATKPFRRLRRRVMLRME